MHTMRCQGLFEVQLAIDKSPIKKGDKNVNIMIMRYIHNRQTYANNCHADHPTKCGIERQKKVLSLTKIMPKRNK